MLLWGNTEDQNNTHIRRWIGGYGLRCCRLEEHFGLKQGTQFHFKLSSLESVFLGDAFSILNCSLDYASKKSRIMVYRVSFYLQLGEPNWMR